MCIFVCLIVQLQCVGYFPWDFPATSINLLLVAIIVNLTKVMISHAKHIRCKKLQPSKEESYIIPEGIGDKKI